MPGEPQVWERVADLEWWLKEYGKAPQEVAEMPAFFVARAPEIAILRNQEQERRSKG